MKSTLSDKIPAYAIHPGELLLDELEARKINQTEFASLIGMSKSQFNEILKGKRGINAEVSLLLETALKISADFWMNAQKNFELSIAKIENKNQVRLQAIEELSIIKDQVAYQFFKKQKLLTGDAIEDVVTLKNIYGIAHLEQLATINANPNYARYRKSSAVAIERTNIIGWTKLVGYLGAQLSVPAFNVAFEKDLIIELKKIITANRKVMNKTKDALHDVGIKLVYQEKAEKCPVDGVSMWSNENPLIGLSLRYNRLDNFAFTLFHELGHVFLHLVNNPQKEYIDMFDEDDLKHKESTEEKQANDFASDQLISKKDWNEFLSNERRMMDDFTIEFAKEINIHPAIIKGRIKHHFNNYSLRTRIDNILG